MNPVVEYFAARSAIGRLPGGDAGDACAPEIPHPTDRRRRILMLVPHEIDVDPRVRWALDLCREVAFTEVVGIRGRDDRPARRQEENARLHELNLIPTHTLGRWTNAVMVAVSRSQLVDEYHAWRSAAVRRPKSSSASPPPTLRQRLGGRLRSFAVATDYRRIAESLYRHARAVCLRPDVILCHDLIALQAGVKLKRLFDCGLIYDCHESWPDEDALSTPGESRRIETLEASLIGSADEVITVTPQLADRLRRRYSVQNVRVVPNVEPLNREVRPACERPADRPVRFLVQGRICPGRGFERLLGSARRLDPERAVLIVRAPENDHLAALRINFADLVRSGRLQFLPAVSEDQLVSAAAESDVGVIPYPPDHPNHEVACPNKLSQYLQAGLAIVSTNLPFVRDLVSRNGCGRTFDLDDETSFPQVVDQITSDAALLQQLKCNARQTAVREFHWQILSHPYRDAIRRFFAEEPTERADAIRRKRRPAA